MTSPLEKVLAALPSPKPNGKGWKARCPAHDDRTPSLSISTGDDDQVLLKCFADCPTERVVAELGLTMRDLFVDPPRTNGRDRVEKIYDYTDENGELLYQVVRKRLADGGKTFPQRRPNGNGGWINNLNGTRRVLYRLPKVLEGVTDGLTVFIVEGEKDADAIAATGAIATTSSEGAGKWKPEYAQHFHGADVVIVADRDKPGYNHARDIRDSLLPVAARVVVTEAVDGKDTSDHLAAGHTLEELALVDLDASSGDEADEAAPTPRIEFKALPSPLTVTPVPMHIKGFLAEGTHSEIAGGEKSLKTHLADATIVAAALGLPVLGQFEVLRPLRVGHMLGEGGDQLHQRVIARTCAAYGVSTDDLADNYRYTTQTARVSSIEFHDAIKRLQDDHQPDVIVLDPWYAITPVGPDAKNLYDIGPALQSLQELICIGSTSLIIVNHFNQTGNGNGLQRITMAGHAEWVDSWWLLSHRTPPDVDAGSFRLAMSIGSRQWGGSNWNVDYEFGHFNEETSSHDGAMSWTARRSTGIASTGPAHDLGRTLEMIPRAVAAAKSAGRGLSGRQLAELMGKGNDKLKRTAMEYAVELGCLRSEDGPRRRVDHFYVRDFDHADADTLRTWAGIEVAEATP